jgi:hypothetical protein
MEAWIKHVKDNHEVFQLWIQTHQTLQPSADILQPIIPEFKKEFPNVDLEACANCIIDMLVWACIQLKKREQGTPLNSKEWNETETGKAVKKFKEKK